ncbi:RHS repeat-associated core domain-containing protein [Flavobacterium psychrophilum]|nr:RHS repeat-associated core domain-containing protein [Flavobacterium psychrophilum]
MSTLNGQISQHVEYIAFGEVLFEEHSSSFKSPYLFNGKELDRETNLTNFGARYLDMKTSLWLNVDPLAEKYPSMSPYNFCYNNPVNVTDPDGRDPGDYYSSSGKHIGNDGIKDDKVYVTDQKTIESNTSNKTTDWNSVKASNNTTDLTEKTGIKHSEFLQMSAVIYNETFGSGLTPKEQLASAISNRLGKAGFGSETWQKSIDRLAYWNDSQDQRMSEERRNPTEGATTPNGKVLLSNIREKNYQNYFNASSVERNADPQMKMSTEASIYRLNGGKDLVNGAYQWRGNGVINIFFKTKKGDTKY